MDKSLPKARRKLNAEQLEVLELLYKFRFGSNDLFAQYFGKKDRSFVYKRLSILLEQGLIGKRFDSSYRLQGKPAAYYLTPAGGRVLQGLRTEEQDAVNIKAIYKDKTVSEQFAQQSMDLFTVYNRLYVLYGDRLKFITKVNLNYERFNYFPQPLPDAYIRLRLGSEGGQYFLNLCYESQPFFTVLRRIKQYFEYAEKGEWEETGTDFPKLLFVCNSVAIKKRLRKHMLSILSELEDGPIVALTTMGDLISDANAVWQLASALERDYSLQAI